MRQSTAFARSTVSGLAIWQRLYDRSIKSVRNGIVCVSSVGALIASNGGMLPYATLHAQTPSPISGRLSVRPHEMATGTRTTQAGEQPVGLLKGVLAYVPKSCVGTRRCPLIVFLHGKDGSARQELDLQSPLADKYGMILLAPDNIAADSAPLDVALTHVLRTFAIDPNKIALAGESIGGMGTLFWGRKNLDVFSRIASLSATSPPSAASVLFGGASESEDLYPTDTTRGPRNDKAQFFVSAGIGEAAYAIQNVIETARREQRDGHVVKSVLNLRLRGRRVQDFDVMWHWLQDSWTPHTTARTKATPSATPSVTAAPLLTAEAITKMMTFWTSFMTGPDATWMTSRTTYQKEYLIPVGGAQMTVFDMVDISAIAAKHASVAAALRNAGLTPQQEEAYRIALISARAAKILESPVEATSILGKNVSFISVYRDIANALEDLIGVPRCENSAEAAVSC